MSDTDYLRFTFEGTTVVRVEEFDDGRWKYEEIEHSETYTVFGNEVIKTEYEHGRKETTTYSDANEDGVYTETSKIYSNGVFSSETKDYEDSLIKSYSESEDDNHSLEDYGDSDEGDDSYVTIDGSVYEVEDDNEYGFDLSVDGKYQVGDDLYLVSNGVVYELEDDGYYEHTGQTFTFNDSEYEIEVHHETLDDQSEDGDLFVVTSQGVRLEVEDGEEAYQEDASLYRLYKAVFDREPDEDGFNYWGGKLDTELSFGEIVNSFVASDEFQAAYLDADDQAFVNQLYLNVLDRVADEGGLKYWLNELDSGISDREDVIVGFSNSEEFINNTSSDFDDYVNLVGLTSVTTDVVSGLI